MRPCLVVLQSKMIHVCIRGRDVFVERDQFEAPEDAVFRAWFLAQHAGTKPHVDEMSRIESCKRRYGTSYSGLNVHGEAGTRGRLLGTRS